MGLENISASIQRFIYKQVDTIFRTQPIAQQNILNSLDKVVKDYKFNLNLKPLESALQKKDHTEADYCRMFDEASMTLRKDNYALLAILDDKSLWLTVRIRDKTTGRLGTMDCYLRNEVVLRMKSKSGEELYPITLLCNSVSIPLEEIKDKQYGISLEKIDLCYLV